MTRALSVLASLALCASAAAVPLELTHQGRLLDASGAPLDGHHALDVSLHDAPVGGAALWSDTFDAEVDAGFFSIVLGAGAALDSSAFGGERLYLELAVDGGAPLPKRIPVVSVPYAIHAGSSDVAASVVVDGASVIGGDGRIAWDRISNAPVDMDTLAALDCLSDQVAVFDGSSWGCGDAGSDHTHDATDLVSGTLSVARLPIGTSGAHVAAGDHTHTAADVGALPDTGGTLSGALSGTSATFSGSVQVGADTDDCDSSTSYGKIRWQGGLLQVCTPLGWDAVWAPPGASESKPATSCKEIKRVDATAKDGVYWLDPLGSGAAFRAHCDMTTDGGGWTMCYTQDDSAMVRISSEVTYSDSTPLGTVGYRSDCREIPFTDVLYIDEGSSKKAWFSRDTSGTVSVAGLGYSAAGSKAGLFTGHGEANTSYKYQLNVCDASWMWVGLMVTGYTSCFKQCGSWCSDTTTDYYRTDGDNGGTYNGVAFQEPGHKNVGNRTLSVGIR